MKGLASLFILFSCLVLSFASMAESPPGLKHDVKFESNNLQAASVSLANFEALGTDGIQFQACGRIQSDLPQTTIEKPATVVASKLPALQHGNNYRLCSTKKAIYNSTTCNPKSPNTCQSNADFKVGWQGFASKIQKDKSRG